MQQAPDWSLLPDEIWTRIVLYSLPALQDGRAVAPGACQLHLRALAALLCTSKQLRAVVQSDEAAAVWSQASVSHHFNWRVWRQLGTAGCDALMRWLTPHASLIEQLHLDIPKTSCQAVQAFAAALAAAPLTHLSCRGSLLCLLPLDQLRSLVITVHEVLSPRGSWPGPIQALPALPQLQRLELRCRTEVVTRSQYSSPWWEQVDCLLLACIVDVMPSITILVVSQTWRTDIHSGFDQDWLEDRDVG